MAALSSRRIHARRPLLGWDAMHLLRLLGQVADAHTLAAQPGGVLHVPNALLDMVVGMTRRAALCHDIICAFSCVIPKVCVCVCGTSMMYRVIIVLQARAPPPRLQCEKPDRATARAAAERSAMAMRLWQGGGASCTPHSSASSCFSRTSGSSSTTAASSR